ncbi:hypothetical protein TanjilG_04165 [Lupinus angustifolius]|uniref:CRM domain-containing protein n=1 Tax=Lupinus angustifolius TaxID=3871 RepID=A0A4P1RK31_LUPAN|nr:hypothetical protein TanjilG_04165 [Lupinus angustifolius]
MLLPSTHSFTFSSSSLPFPNLLLQNRTRTRTRISFIRSSASETQTLPNSAIQRIAEKLRSLGITDDATATATPPPTTAAGKIFVPLPHQLPKYRVGHTIDSSWSTFDNPVPVPGTGISLLRQNELASVAKQQKKKEVEESRAPTLAELNLSKSEIRRLTTLGLGLGMKQKLKVGKAGITEGIVNGIHERWQRVEVVRIVCEDISKLNMKRTHDLLERKTGGLVVWRSGFKLILYRGADYKYPYFISDKVSRNDNTDDALQHSENGDDQNSDIRESHSSEFNSATSAEQSSNFNSAKPALIEGVGSPNKVRFQLPGEAELAEDADRLLVGLGPRFTDWWGYDPLPIDADLLPAVVPGYRKPFRLLPYGVSSKLTDDEMTTMRRLARPLPCHFALGRNRKHQGLAAAIIKLWERCEIAKIAIKRGVQNTNSELMAEELKYLTGGTLLARDREFIVFYRGKDFLPAAVSSAIEKRRNIGIYKDKLKAQNSSSVTVTPNLEHGTVECDSEGNGMAFQKDTAVPKQRKLAGVEAAIKKTSIRLSEALERKTNAEKLLAELNNTESLQEQEIDKEGITEEERYMLRRIGLKMKPFLLLGRRGVYDGTVENMHLHWKYRELVKVLCKPGSLEFVYEIARTLEAESGGILVAVERARRGYAIIVYRGKNYIRPASLRPQTLLSRRAAMKRSIEAQRRESLKLHVLKLDKNINQLKLQLDKDKEANSKQIEEVTKLDLAADKDKDGVCSNSINLDSPKEACVENQQPVQEEQLELIDDGGIQEQQLELIDDGGVQEQQLQLTGDGGIQEQQLQLIGDVSDSVVETEHCVSNNKEIEPSVTSSKSDPEPSAPMINRSSNKLPSRSVHLSNKERLLLRKQALMMKKRPVLAVGKSNTVTGVAKTINTHFKKHPFAIVNVKGRAKGTSVQEVVLKLEQATGAVLVSQEPSNVILYRGWGAGETSGTERNVNKVRKERGSRPIVSPELLEAIRVECGLK